jgi:hypothetical protein
VKWLDKENIWALLSEQNSVVDYLRWDEHREEYVNSKGVSMEKNGERPNRTVWQSTRSAG